MIIGHVYLVVRRAMTWRSKKQVIIVLSSIEAEYIAMSEAAQEVCWLRNLYDELGFTQLLPTILKGDNEGSIAMTLNLQFHQRSKHIAIRYHWVRDLVRDGFIDVESCCDAEQMADVLTKALLRPKFK